MPGMVKNHLRTSQNVTQPLRTSHYISKPYQNITNLPEYLKISHKLLRMCQNVSESIKTS